MGKHVFTLDTVESQYFETSSGGLIHFKKHKGKTPWVVFVHGAGSNHSTWKPYLTDEISWLVFDIRSHGRSSRADINLDAILQDMHELITQETEGKVVLVGNSFGTLLVEKYYYAYPNMVSKIIFCSPYSKNFSYGSSFIALLSRLIGMALGGRTSKRKLVFNDYWKYAKRPIWYYPYLDFRGTSLSNIANTLALLFGNEINLSGIKIPTDVLVGKNDFYCKKNKIRKVSERNKHITFHLLGSHHLIVMRNPGEVKPIIERGVLL